MMMRINKLAADMADGQNCHAFAFEKVGLFVDQYLARDGAFGTNNFLNFHHVFEEKALEKATKG